MQAWVVALAYDTRNVEKSINTEDYSDNSTTATAVVLLVRDGSGASNSSAIQCVGKGSALRRVIATVVVFAVTVVLVLVLVIS